MLHFLELVNQLMSHTILVHVYSSPNFVIETFMGLMICFVHVLLIMEVGNALKQVHVRPVKIARQKSLREISSKFSDNASVIRNHPDLGVEVVFNENSFLKGDWDTIGKINKMLSTSLSEYIRSDLNKIKTDLVEGENLNVKLKPSMEKVCDILLQQPEMQKRMAFERFDKADKIEVLH